MTRLKLGPILDEKPIKLTIELPASVHHDLVAYAEVLSSANGQVTDPAKLAPHMIARFIASDREFAKRRRTRSSDVQANPSEMAADIFDQAAAGASVDQPAPGSPELGSVGARLADDRLGAPGKSN